ncbi:MAG: ABC transporter substrate-binding protein [Opitutales bacterium]|nr:ABC transporter substrate-binding protein [Opitutales bacterium]
MDPVQGSSQYANLMNTSIFDTLYEYKYLKKPYELKPLLASAMPEVSEDGILYTIPIEKGVHFTDDPCFPDGVGRELTAEDFVYSIKRMFDPKNQPQGAWLWQGRIKGLDEWKEAGSDYEQPVEGLRAKDRYTIEVELTQPYPQLVYTFAMGYSGVVPREAVEYYGKEFGIKPVGSGPYQLVKFSTKKAVLKRNPKFREQIFDLEYEGYVPEEHDWANVKLLQGKTMPIMENVEVYFMRESMTRWNSLNKGNEIQLGTIPIELTHMVAESLKPLVLKPEYAKKFNGMNLPDFGLVYFLFNMDDPKIGYHPDPEQNHRNFLLRKAIRAGYDWNQRNRRFYNNVGDIFPGIIPRGLDAFDETLPMDSVTADYEQAKAYLKEGGWTAENLPVLDYHSGTGVIYVQFFEQFRGWMEKIGYPREKIKLNLHATFGDFSKAMKNKECMVWGMGWGLDYPDSENVLQLFYGPNKSPGSNASNYDNPEFNELFRKAKVMQPGPERTELYKKMNKMIIEDVPVLTGLTRNSPYIWHKNVVFHHSRNPHASLLKYAYVFDESELEKLEQESAGEE